LGSIRLGLPMLAAAALAFTVLSVIEGRPARTMLTPPIPAPESPFRTRVAGLGVVEPKSETVAIATDLGGVVKRIYVADGQWVAAGAPLFALDDRDYRAALADADANVQAREAALKTIAHQIQSQQAQIAQEQAKRDAAVAQLGLARTTRDRDTVLANEQLISRQLFDSATADEQTADATAAAAAAGLIAAQRQSDVLAAQQIEAQALLKEAQASRQRAAITLDKSVVRAPIDATVLKVNIHPGEYAQPGVLTTPLLTLGALDQLHLRVEVDQEDAWRIAAGAPAIALVRGNPSLRTPLKFVRFEPMVVPKHSLSGTDDRVDTRVLEAIYSFDPSRFPARVGQELDVFIAAPSAVPELPVATRQDPVQH
jgi:HlyD family secretion protein